MNNKNVPEIIKRYYNSGTIRYEIYHINNNYHRIDGPAYIIYYETGQIYAEEYYLDNKLHRLDGPAWIRYFRSGKIETERYFVDDILLYDFESYCQSKKEIFEYVRRYPHYLKEVALLARHNNWLNKKELELLSCIDMFI